MRKNIRELRRYFARRITYCLLRSVVLGCAILGLSPVSNAASPPEKCQIDRMVGRVVSIEGHVDSVRITRLGKQKSASVGECLVFNDRLDVDDATTVILDTAQGLVYVGRDQRTNRWQAPEERLGRDRRLPAGTVNAIWHLLDSFWLEVPVTGAGRSGASCRISDETGGSDDASTPGRFAGLPLLRNAGVQQLPVDSDRVIAPWGRDGSEGLVDVVLLRETDGYVVSSTNVCQATYAVLMLPPGALHFGEKLHLEVRTRGRAPLIYKIQVADVFARSVPSVFPQSLMWLQGAWELQAGAPAWWLDALSRIQAESDHYYGAKALFAALLGGWTMER